MIHFQNSQILFPYLVLDELLLQGTIHILCLGDDEQSAGSHVEPMDNHTVRIAFLHDGFHAILPDTAWHRKQAGRLVHY